jgi:hypothetical protein
MSQHRDMSQIVKIADFGTVRKSEHAEGIYASLALFMTWNDRCFSQVKHMHLPGLWLAQVNNTAFAHVH